MTMSLFMDLLTLGLDPSILVTTLLEFFNLLEGEASLFTVETTTATMVGHAFRMTPNNMAYALFSNKLSHRQLALKFLNIRATDKGYSRLDLARIEAARFSTAAQQPITQAQY